MIAQCLQKIIDIFSRVSSRWWRTFVNSMITWNCGPSGGQDCNNILRNSRDSIDCALLVKYRRCHGQCIQVKDSVFLDESFLGLQGPHVLSKTCSPAPKKTRSLIYRQMCLRIFRGSILPPMFWNGIIHTRPCGTKLPRDLLLVTLTFWQCAVCLIWNHNIVATLSGGRI